MIRSFRLAGLVALILSFPAAAQQLGAVLDKAAFAASPKAPPLSRGDFASLPRQASLKSFAPHPGDQGQQSSCVGWATAYAARTILATATGESASSSQTFSPAFVYNQIYHNNCDGGSRVSDALSLLSGDGVATLASFPYDADSCSRQPSSSQRQLASQYRIGEWRRLFDSTSVNKHIPVRRALAEGHPVVIAMQLPYSFMDYEGGVFHATPAEYDAFLSDDPQTYAEYIAGGHAMAAIGYDDDGEWIEIINSWSPEWGERGYVRVSWDTFNTFVVEAYEVMPQPAPDPPQPQPQPQPKVEPQPAPQPQPAPEPVAPPPTLREMHAQLRFIDLQGTEIAARSDATGWRLSRALPSGARFRVEATPGLSANIYVLGAGADGQFVELFPRSQLVSSRVGADHTLLLPGPTEDHYTQLDETPGDDTYLVLVSRLSLDLPKVLNVLERTTGQPLDARLAAALGTRLVDGAQVTPRAQGIGFDAQGDAGDVVVMPVHIDHVAPAPGSVDRTAPRIVLTSPSRDAFDAASGAPFVVTSRDVIIEGRAQDDGKIASVAIDGAQSMRHSDRGPFRAQITLASGNGPQNITITATDVAGNTSTETLRFVLRN